MLSEVLMSVDVGSMFHMAKMSCRNRLGTVRMPGLGFAFLRALK